MASTETLEYVSQIAVPQYHLSNYGLNTVLFKGEHELIVAGYASPQVIDREKHLITKEALRNDLPRFMANPRYRNVNLLHSNVQVGEVIPEWTDPKTGEQYRTKVDDIGLFAVIKVRTDANRPEIMDRVEKDILEGKLASFSISADAPFESRRHECVGGTCFWVIDRIQLYEITICETPVNQSARFTIISKAEGAKPNPAEFMASAYCQDGSCPLTPAITKSTGLLVPPQNDTRWPAQAGSDGVHWHGGDWGAGTMETPDSIQPAKPAEAAKLATPAKGVKEIEEADPDLLAKTHSIDRCMECKSPPTKSVLWAEGMARAWFCDEHFEEWQQEHADDIVAVKDVDNGRLMDKHMGGSFGADPNDIHYHSIDYDKDETSLWNDPTNKGAPGLSNPGMSMEAAQWGIQEDNPEHDGLNKSTRLNLSNDNYYHIFASTAAAMSEALNNYLTEEDETITRAVLAAIQTGDIDFLNKGTSSEWVAWVPNGSGVSKSFIIINDHIDHLLGIEMTGNLLLAKQTLDASRPLSGYAAKSALESALMKMDDVQGDLGYDTRAAIRKAKVATLNLLGYYGTGLAKSSIVDQKIRASKDALGKAVYALEESVMNSFVRESLDGSTLASLDAAYDGIRNAIDGIALGDQMIEEEGPELQIIKDSGATNTLPEVEQADKILSTLKKSTDETTPRAIATEMANNISTDREGSSLDARPEPISPGSLPDGNREATKKPPVPFDGFGDNFSMNEGWLNKAGGAESAMIAWFVPPDIAQKIVWEDSEPAENLHCTLVYLPDGIGEKEVRALNGLLAKFLQNHPPLTGALGGVGRFSPSKSSDGKPVWYAVVDVPGLSKLRHELVDELSRAGFKIAENHDYNPHITLKYGETLAFPESVDFDSIPVTIGSLTVAFGGSGGGRLEEVDFGTPTPENKAMGLNTSDHDVLSYGRLFDSMWRKGIRDPKFALAVKAVRDDGTVEYLDLGDY